MNNKTEIDMIDVLLYASAPYTGKNEIEAYNVADPEIRLSEKAKKRIQNRLRREREYKEQHERYSPVWEISKRVAVIILVVLSVSFVSVMSVEAVRVALWEAILEWGEESIHIWYESTDGEPEVLTEILEYKEPRGIGDEYVRYEGYKNDYRYCVEYEKNDCIITYHQELLKDNSMYLSNEDTSVQEIQIQSHLGIMSEFFAGNTKITTITWTDDEYIYILIFNTLTDGIPFEDMIEIAESVQ